jgi:hypothetical protein
MADDIATVKKIYAMADLPMTEQAATELQRFINDHPRGKHGRVVYKLKEDFEVDPDELRKRFDFYFRQFPVQAETKS